MRNTRSTINKNGQKPHDEVFVADKSENETDTDTERSPTEPDYENSETETETEQDVREITDIVKNLRAQIAEQSNTVRDGIRNVHIAMAQMKEIVQNQQDWIVERISALEPQKRSRFVSFMRITGLLTVGVVMGIFAVAASVAWNVHNEIVE